jgi:hypothetical protein
MKICTMIEQVLKTVMARLRSRFARFDACTTDLWSNVTAERFRKVQELIVGDHTTIGGVLCALTVKMDAWSRMFPSKEVGGPMKRAGFILAEMCPGFERIIRLERVAPASRPSGIRVAPQAPQGEFFGANGGSAPQPSRVPGGSRYPRKNSPASAGVRPGR